MEIRKLVSLTWKEKLIMANGDAVILGSEDNSAADRTSLTKTQGFLPVLDLFNNQGVGLLIIAGESAVHPGGEVIPGEALAAFSPGTAVVGTGDVSGVFGTGEENGVEGHCETGTGVFARSNSGTGVWAQTATGLGVNAISDGSIAVRGQSNRSAGVVGLTFGSGGSVGVLGVAGGTGTGVLGFSSQGNAGAFFGPVVVSGDFTVIGGSKSAAVPYPDGSYRLLYAVESPDCWLEDFGRAKLIDGEAIVKLKDDFAAVIDFKQMHIFLSPEGDCNGLYLNSMPAQNTQSFSVGELQNGKSSLSFSYRIVGKRKDIRGQRMKKVKVPKRPAIAEAEAPIEKVKPREAKKMSFYK
jgi:hypothetical protein